MSALSNTELLAAIDTRIAQTEEELTRLRRARTELAVLSKAPGTAPANLIVVNKFPPSPRIDAYGNTRKVPHPLFDLVAELLMRKPRTILEIAEALQRKLPDRDLSSLRSSVHNCLTEHAQYFRPDGRPSWKGGARWSVLGGRRAEAA